MGGKLLKEGHCMIDICMQYVCVFAVIHLRQFLPREIICIKSLSPGLL